MTIALVLALLLGAWLALGRRMLLAWFLRDIRRVPVSQTPDETIVTYPLA